MATDTKELQAGPELDQRIAVEVMQLPKAELGGPCADCGGETRIGINRAWCYQCSEWKYSAYREYSDYIDAAWQVVEKLLDHTVHLSHTPGSKVWKCDVFTAGKQGLSAFGDTAPLAICRAALLSVGR